MLSKLCLHGLVLVLALAGSADAGSRGEAADLCERIIIEGGFVKSRGLLKYVTLLGPSFMTDVARLGPRGIWADMGAGRGDAVREYKNWGGRAGVMAASFESLETLRLLGEVPEGMRILDGRFVEDIPPSELGRADVITDVYGAMSYSSRIDKVLERYFRMLKPGGAIYLHSFEAHTVVTGPGGTNLFLREWLQTLPGVHAERTWRMVDFGETIRLTLDGSEPFIPTLVLREASEGWPPSRAFAEIGH